MEQILPKIDLQKLQEKANEAAQKGAESEINDFYNGYSSPYKKAIKEQLENKGVSIHLGLPDVIALMNEKLSSQIDQIANNAIAQTYLPMVTEILTRAEPEVKFSDVLKAFIESTDFRYEEHIFDDYTAEFEEGSYSSGSSLNEMFQHLVISGGGKSYNLHLHNENMKNEHKEKRFSVMGLPREQQYSGITQTMKISVEGGATLEMPFTQGVLQDKFVSYIAGLVIANSTIIFDVEDFNEDLFPERDGCHC